MSQVFECGDSSSLVAYVYDECEPEVRTAIDDHVEHCVSCSRDLEGLGWTRTQLTAWTPPEAELGFQMPVLARAVPVPWWRAPLPAWAQAAAAILIFAAGLSVGAMRQSATPAPSTSVAEAPTPTVQPASKVELSALEERLKAEIAQLRQPAASTVAEKTPSSEEAVMRQVRSLLEASEERQRREFTLRSVDLARDFEAQRRIDLASVRETVGQLQGVTGAEIRQQREAIDRLNNFIRVSQQGR